MRIIESNIDQNVELPLQLEISFGKIFDIYKKYASEEFKEHPYHKSSVDLVAELEQFPDLLEGFSDFSLLKKHERQVELLLEPLFPEALLDNEIKAASIPFSFLSFKFTENKPQTTQK